MNLLIKREIPADQKCNVLNFLLDEQLFNLTAHDMRTTLGNAGLEYHESQTSPGTSMSNFTSIPSPAPLRSPIHLSLPHSRKVSNQMTHLQMWINLNEMIPQAPPINLNATCPLDTSCDHLLHLDSPSLSSELQDNSSVDSVEINLLRESEVQLGHVNLSPADVFHGNHDYEQFLIQKELDAPNDNLNHQDSRILSKDQKSFWSCTHVNSC